VRRRLRCGFAGGVVVASAIDFRSCRAGGSLTRRQTECTQQSLATKFNSQKVVISACASTLCVTCVPALHRFGKAQKDPGLDLPKSIPAASWNQICRGDAGAAEGQAPRWRVTSTCRRFISSVAFAPPEATALSSCRQCRYPRTPAPRGNQYPVVFSQS